jgi:hypothetical protein
VVLIHISRNETIPEITNAELSIPIGESELNTGQMVVRCVLISTGLDNNTKVIKTRVSARLIVSIADAKPYDKTTKFLFDLYHEKKRLASKHSKKIDKA